MQKSNATASQKNIHAIFQQRRLRHVSGICIRNLSLIGPQGGKPERRKLFIKITNIENINSHMDVPVIFESEHVAFRPNPSWLGFDLTKSKQTIRNSLHVELCIEDDEGRMGKVFSWNCTLSRLCYIAERLYQVEISFAPNALVLQIHGSFYSFSNCFTTDTPHGNCPHFNLDEEKVSCNVFSLRRMVTSQKSISQSKQRCVEYKGACDGLIQGRELQIKRRKEIEDLKGRILMLKLLLSRETSLLKCERGHLSRIHSGTKSQSGSLSANRATVMQERDRFNEVSSQIVTNQQRTALLKGQLASRRIEIFSELAYIFPIHPYSPTAKNSNSTKNAKQPLKVLTGLTICGIHLPAAENLNAKEDSRNAVALGYVSQMLHMISYFVLVPMRYPLILQGSQTSIVDYMTEKIQDKERVFPLFVKTNKERFLFEYGMYLLNKNLAQIRYVMGISTSDLRLTLQNLKSLLDHAIDARPVRTLTVQPSTSISSRSPSRKATPKPVKNRDTPTPADLPPNSEMNGVHKAPADLEEKVHDKSLELHNLRGELFGSNKRSRPLPVSPRHSASAGTPLKISPSVPRAKFPSGSAKLWNHDTKIFGTDSTNPGAAFLTGLEDLDCGSKTKSDSQKPLDIVTARNELFKTKSGRHAVTKRHAHTIHSGKFDDQLSTKNQPSRTPSEASSSGSNTGSVKSSDALENGESLNDEAPTKELSYPIIPARVSVPEDIDLC